MSCVLVLAGPGCSGPADPTTLPSTSGVQAGEEDDAGPAKSGGDPSSSPPTTETDDGAAARDDDCSDAAKLVYVVDSSGELSSFRPDSGAFVSIGQLDCPSMGGVPNLPLPIPGLGGSPFSMSVDRAGIAWVLYDSGELFRVDTLDASCTATSRTPGGEGFSTFGMGFASDAAGSSEETLYIAGAGGGSFGSLELQTMVATAIGSVSGSPELTGTGAGELWGFFPDTSPPRIDQMDKASGAATRSIPLGSLQGSPAAWAFAFWGGDFWLFLQRATDLSTVVYRVDAETGMLSTSIPDTGKRIVGAGVSTCAPLEVF